MNLFPFFRTDRHIDISGRFNEQGASPFRFVRSVGLWCKFPCIFLLILKIYTLQVLGQGVEQPIVFNHKTHAGDFAISCEFCHIYTERSQVAGIPSIQNCIGCHTVIRGEEEDLADEISLIFDYWKSGRPIPWRKIYDLPDFVYFSHRAHSVVGIECTECHGEVEQQEALSLENMHADLNMGWCIDCHTAKTVVGNDGGAAAAEYLQGSVDCMACHK